MERWWNRWRTLSAWPFAAALFAICGGVGLLQYRWIGEVSLAERDRLAKSLQGSLERLSRDFDAEIASGIGALAPAEPAADPAEARRQLVSRFRQWQASARHPLLFSRLAAAGPDGEFLSLNQETATLEPAAWPASWAIQQQRMTDFRRGPGRGAPPSGRGFGPGRERGEPSSVAMAPLLTVNRRPGGPDGFEPRDEVWLLAELDDAYLRDQLAPELARRHLSSSGELDYSLELWTRGPAPELIYRSGGEAQGKQRTPDASVGLYPARLEQGFGFRGPGNSGLWDPGRANPPGGGINSGRWELRARHRGGSLEDIVAETRRRNLALNAGALLLMAASAAALFGFARRAKRLAELQLEFVAGVSHELRTPLTVIHTAAHNLRGKLAHNPAQVERYGELIQKESARLRGLVEQVMQFAGANAGHVIGETRPLELAGVVREALESAAPGLEAAQCQVETRIPADLPLVQADPLALRQAILNLLDNALKYGAAGNGWAGVFASHVRDRGRVYVELAVADRGPGIPSEELGGIFDPFFRGKTAVTSQIRGAGLGLNIVKKIVEAHGGSVRVKSAPGKGAEFVLKLPAALRERVDELANSPD